MVTVWIITMQSIIGVVRAGSPSRCCSALFYTQTHLNYRTGSFLMSQSPNAEELRTKQEREAALMAALPEQIAHAQQSAPAFAKILSGIDARTIHTREKILAKAGADCCACAICSG